MERLRSKQRGKLSFSTMLLSRGLGMTVALLVASGLFADAFQPIHSPSQQCLDVQPSPLHSSRGSWSRQKPSFVLGVLHNNHDLDGHEDTPKKAARFGRIRRRISKFTKKKLATAIMVGAATAGFWNVATPQRADASAPVMAVPKAEQRDPATDALLNHERKMVAKEQAELQETNQKARAIEENQGQAARVKFEKEYRAQKEKEAQENAEGLEQLKRDLLDQGIDPVIDLEGQRQVILYEKGLDLGKVPGTMMYLEKQLETSRNPKNSQAYKQAPNRRVIKAIVQDLKNKGIDPLAYFEQHQDKTKNLLGMPPMAAAQMALQYEANLEQYGQVNVPKEGEMSVLEKRKLSGADKKQDAEAKKKEKEEKKQAKAEAKAKAAAEKKQAKEEAKSAKEAAKKEKEAFKAAEKAAAAATATAAAGAASSSAALSATASAIESFAPEAPSSADEAGIVEPTSDVEEVIGSQGQATSVAAPTKSSDKVNIGGRKIGVVPLAGLGVITVGGGGYAFKLFQDKAAATEEERQRQFRLLMGEERSSPNSAPALEVVDSDDDFGIDPPTKTEEKAPSPAAAPPAVPKKKRRGFFGKKNKNDRETDLSVLVSADAKAPQFATLLAKILTYGAPGRFPSVEAFPGEMPLKEFDLEAAKQQLVDARAEASIEVEDSAEIFANVVNCMLIDIVDLASSTLKSKDEKLTVDGIKVVVDFMNHAASLYDSVASGVTIKPVTYGGDLGKGQLEKMYTAYAASGMDMTAALSGDADSADFQAGVDLLQDVFQIPNKKAEGLAMKILQKNMMKMMKDGKGMEEMMAAMGGEEGMAGLAGMEGLMGDGSDIDPEELKNMLRTLKEMKDSGAFGPEDFEEVRKQFKEAYGASIDDVMKDGMTAGGEEFGTEDQELLDLMKSILEE